MIEEVNEAVAFLQHRGMVKPDIGIILGTGLGALTNHVDTEITIPYEEIPHFPVSTVESHHGKLIYGTLEGRKVLVMSGRFHYYEGYSMSEVVFPVRVMRYLGIQKLLVSNASGCMNLNWKKGELMLLDDHINLLPDNPLRGKEAPAFGSIFTDLHQPYDAAMNSAMKAVAEKESIVLREGVYVGVAGPNLETRAEYRFLRMIGADVVGMSTVPEVIAANQMGLPVSAVSVLTDECDPDNLHPTDIADILTIASEAEHALVTLFRGAIRIL